MPRLPDRVIWVNPNDKGDIRLVEPLDDAHAQYIALSYCWGPTEPSTFLTSQATYPDRKAGINAADLPPLFLDIITCAHMLRIEFIWIDRLCIIQGDKTDWEKQAPKMGQYYGNATMTFVAASAESEMGQILVERDRQWGSSNLQVEIDQIGSLNLRFRRRPYRLWTEYRGGNYGKVSTRAWIWQERLLAARTITFTPSGLKFECHEHSVWEGYADQVTSPSWSARLKNINLAEWWRLVQEFTRRDITYSSDRLPALESVMQRVANAQGWTPLWGMWKDYLAESLGWAAYQNYNEIRGHQCRVHPEYYAPSWSWASVEGPVDFRTDMQSMASRDDPYKTSLEVLIVDTTAGALTVFAHWCSVELLCSIGRPYDGTVVAYEYECTNVPPTPDLPDKRCGDIICADVALQPMKWPLSSQGDNAVVRLPHGVELPQRTWKCKCIALLLGHTSSRANVLLLGESQRIPGAYERIAFANAWPPHMFTGKSKMSFKIA